MNLADKCKEIRDVSYDASFDAKYVSETKVITAKKGLQKKIIKFLRNHIMT